MNLDHQNDEQILSLIRVEETSEKGFRLLMNKYQERLYWHIRKMVQIHEDADDVIQNTFIKVYRNIDKFQGQSKLYTWLYRIATNESITLINKKKKKQSFSIDDELNILEQNLKADDFFDGDEAALKLNKALKSLPDKQRAVFNMRYYEAMSYNDISEVLGTSVGALKASYHHAAKKIEAFLTEQ